MKHRLLFTLLLGGMAIGASAQSSYTIKQDLSSKIQNANFGADTPVSHTVVTYDDNMPDQGAGSGVDGAVGLFGMQPVVGWTASHPTDNTMVSTSHAEADRRTDGLNAMAAGVFAYYDDTQDITPPGLGGDEYLPPYIDSSTNNQGLGMVAVWGSDISYTQNVSLPKGAYMLEFKVYNSAGGGTLSKSNFGYVVDETTSYMTSTTTISAQEWETISVAFILNEATDGKVSVGYQFSGGSGSAPHLFVDEVKLYEIDEAELIQEEIDKLKEELLGLIEMGTVYGVDTSASQAVYDNPSATMEQVEAAIAAQKELNDSGLTDLSEAFITNPHFTEDNAITGGICTYDYDMVKNSVNFFGSQPLYGWNTPEGYETDNTEVPGRGDSNPNGRASGIYNVGEGAFIGGTDYIAPTTLSDGVTKEGKVLGFVTCWGKTVQYMQNVSLPAGKYTLTLSYYNTGGQDPIAKNLIGFVEDNGTEHLGTKTTFPLNTWTKETIEFTLEEETTGYFSMGYTADMKGSGKMPHFFTDGISLVYVGTGIDATFLALKSAVTGGEKLLEENFNAELKQAFETVVNAGRELVDSESDDKDANRAATEAIKSKLSEVNASIDAYKRLQTFLVGDLGDALDKYETKEPALYVQLSTLSDDVSIALDEFTWTKDQIDEAIASLPVMIRTYVQGQFDKAVAEGKHLDKDLDISILYNTGYKYSTGEAKGAGVPDKQWVFGNASNFKTQYGTAEVWNQTPFEVSQTLTEMPAGVYTLKVRAFYRTASNDVNYSSYNPDDQRAFLFAGSQKTALANVYEIASSDPEEFNPGSAAAVEGEAYVPNTRESAHNVFENSVYDEKLLKSVSTVLTDAGDLKFGIKADAMESDCWVVWYTFELYYNAIEGNDQVINDELEAKINEASIYANEGCSGVNQTLITVANAVSDGEEALDRGTTEERLNALRSLNSAIALAQESATLVEELNTMKDKFDTMDAEYGAESSSTEFSDICNTIASGEFESNESIVSMKEQLPAAWAKYILGRDMSEASEANPVDITGIILNPSFELLDASYWTLSEDMGQNQGYQNAEYTNTDGTLAVSHFIEVWRKSTNLNDGEVSQELLSVLPEGYYTLSAVGYGIRQESAGTVEDPISGAGLMAKVGDEVYFTDMCLEGTAAEPTEYSVSFYSDGVSPVTVGLKVEGTNASWLAADNFTLSFIGSEAPTGIEDIETSGDVLKLENAVIYNMSGQRLNRVQRGINIINGKKVYIK